MCNAARKILAPKIVLAGPATDALEKARKRAREDLSAKASASASASGDLFDFSAAFNAVATSCGDLEESFPSIGWDFPGCDEEEDGDEVASSFYVPVKESLLQEEPLQNRKKARTTLKRCMKFEEGLNLLGSQDDDNIDLISSSSAASASASLTSRDPSVQRSTSNSSISGSRGASKSTKMSSSLSRSFTFNNFAKSESPLSIFLNTNHSVLSTKTYHHHHNPPSLNRRLHQHLGLQSPPGASRHE